MKRLDIVLAGALVVPASALFLVARMLLRGVQSLDRWADAELDPRLEPWARRGRR